MGHMRVSMSALGTRELVRRMNRNSERRSSAGKVTIARIAASASCMSKQGDGTNRSLSMHAHTETHTHTPSMHAHL